MKCEAINEASAPLPMGTMSRWLLLAIITAGFILRFWGLSHDLHEWNDYHPDTAKQVRAVERFLGGQYYVHYGDLDYDAYPYFNAHLVEYLYRAAELAHNGCYRLVGVPYEKGVPNLLTLWWLMRAWNALLATVLILVVFKIGRENFGRAAGLTAAALLAVSPADIVSCHYATCDTTAAFFATLSVLYAFRIYRYGRCRDYALAAICAACAFAAKYHGGMAILPALAAHILRAGGLRPLFKPGALGRIAVMAVAGVVMTFLAMPTLFTHFTETVQNIIAFFFQISSYRGIPENIRFGGKLAKFMFSIQRNLPIMAQILGPVVCLGAILGLIGLVRGRARYVILYSMPVVFMIALLLRPAAHPVYHTLITPCVFLMAAVVLTAGVERTILRSWRWAARIVQVGLIAGACGFLLRAAIHEDYFFWHQDVSRMAQAWLDENIPRRFNVVAESYTCSVGGFAPEETAQGSLRLGNMESRPMGRPVLKRFFLEPISMAVFRNLPITMYLGGSSLIQNDFRRPVYQRQPSLTGNQFIFDNGPEFLRSEKLMQVEPKKTLVKWLVSERPLEMTRIILQNSAIPNHIAFTLGGVRREISLAAEETACLEIPKLRARFPTTAGGPWFYRLQVSAAYGNARVGWATDAADAGTMLYNLDRFQEAAPLLCQAALETKNPTLAAQALIGAAAAGRPLKGAEAEQLKALVAPMRNIRDADSFRRVYGISPEYLESLDFIRLEAEQLSLSGFVILDNALASGGKTIRQPPADSSQTNPVARCIADTQPLRLDPGCYTVSVRLQRQAPSASGAGELLIWASDMTGAVCDQKRVKLEAPGQDARAMAGEDFFDIQSPLRISKGGGEYVITIQPFEVAAVEIDSLTIKPNCMATVTALNELSQAVIDRGAGLAPQPAEPKHDRAFPDIAVSVLFKGGTRLIGARLSADAVRRGDPLGVGFNWRFETAQIPLERLVVFVHFVDQAGRIAFQADYRLMDRLRFPQLPDCTGPFSNEVRVPESVKSGRYTIRMGVYDSDTGDRYDVLDGTVPHGKNDVHLPLNVEVRD
ncbi:MAG: glycosyltransferase family 39 protein [Kiritimatiellaeota bacterium]|nr:glycosyltransferase family 39 protein [Kiritimatiellota bacterium]